jgi:NAD(P)-dependent dehydrogenase (short-subunit alcohol dehydrogenase family)
LYSAAKAAVLHVSKSVALELAASGVRVNCICPGGIATPIIGQLVGLTPSDGDKIVPTAAAAFSRAVPLRRAGQPDDVARAALWLASDDSSFVTGHALVVDGGLSAGRPWKESSDTFRRVLKFADPATS